MRVPTRWPGFAGPFSRDLLAFGSFQGEPFRREPAPDRPRVHFKPVSNNRRDVFKQLERFYDEAGDGGRLDDLQPPLACA